MDREQLGRLVRETFVRQASRRPDAKPSHLVPWERMPEEERETDRLIGEAVAAAAVRGGALARAVEEHLRQVDSCTDCDRKDSHGLDAVREALAGSPRERCAECGKPVAPSYVEVNREVELYKYGMDAPSCWRVLRGSCSTPREMWPEGDKKRRERIRHLAAARRTALLHQQLNRDSRSAAESVAHYSEKIAEAVCGEAPDTGIEGLVDEERAAARRDALREAARLCTEAAVLDAKAGFPGGPALGGMAVALERLAGGGARKPECFCGAPSCDICHG